MKKRGGKLSAIAFAIAVAGSLSFGARVAFAAPAMMDCPNDGWTTLGACLTTEECTANCIFVHGDQAQGRCRNGCCSCVW